ncbi:hypothetical protein Btru_004175 [Bulinus truncatus]|nr:hypothetical protein Btru_004175 [Bulinus truncatus]
MEPKKQQRDDLQDKNDMHDLANIDCDQLYQYGQGNIETELSNGTEADLHRHCKDCKKNPDHKGFTPVETFSLQNLPDEHHDTDLYEVIKAVAELTVRVTVKFISLNRPEFWPGTDILYPFYNMRGKENCRTGTGMVFQVRKYTNGYSENKGQHLMEYRTCKCVKCQYSDSPSNTWWEVAVRTASHVVFDKTEAKYTACRLFFDRQDSPLVVLDNLSFVTNSLNIEEDWCNLNYMTCDELLADKLNKMVAKFEDHWRKVRDKYWSCKDEIKLVFLVSHPHGCPKQISIGRWIDKHTMSENIYRFTYTASTCPGSSGAKVFCVGYYGMGWYQPTHRGALNSELNYSGTGHVV